MFGTVLSVAKVSVSFLSKPFKLGMQRLRVWAFQLRSKKPPLPEDRAKEIAYSVLAGDVLRAISFRNLGSPHLFIASLRRSSERDFDLRAYVMEQAGKTFRVVWKSDPLCTALPTAIEVRDIDNDGNREVVLEDQSYGTGGGAKSLIVYSISKSRVFSITESLNWQNRTGPISPEIEIKAADAPEMVRVLEEVAMKHGFLQPNKVVDFDLAEFSVQRWHKENGARTSGATKIHYYNGYPPDKSTVVATLDSSTMWISFFKGPLIAYEKIHERHYVVYSPAWSYNWVKCLAWNGKLLWFGSHCKKGLMSFYPGQNLLETHEVFRGIALPEIETLELREDTLIVNGELRIPIDELMRVDSENARRRVN